MLRRRLISAAIIISAMLVLLWIDFWLGTDGGVGRSGIVLCLLAILASAMAASELVTMFGNVANRVSHGTVVGAAALMVTVASAPVMWTDYPVDCPLGHFGWSLSGIVLALVVVFFFEMKNFDQNSSTGSGEVIDRLGRSSFIFLYLIMLFGFLIAHRFLISNTMGVFAVVAVISVVKLSDACAYFAGKKFGTIKLAPRLSPGKTLQGSIGALVGGVLGALFVVYVIAPVVFDVVVPKPFWWVLIYGVLVTMAGMMGDLAESLIKRDSNTKDSSSWLPGLGGVLDILDSLVFAAPVSYLLWTIAKNPVVLGT